MKGARMQNFMMAQSVATKRLSSNPQGKRISKVTWQKLRDNAMNKTGFCDISQHTELPALKTESAVHPQLEVVEFYKEGQIPNDSYDPQSAKSHRRQMHERKIGYREPAVLENILEDFKGGQISFVGQAGSGKTTLLKAITRQVIEGKYKNLSNIQVVHFVELRTFKRSELVTPAELLFSNVIPEMSDAEMNQAMQYAKQNPDKVLFVIDSLDTLSYTIDGVYTGITTEDRASPEAILFHLLSGNLLPGNLPENLPENRPGCRIITSSREYAIRNYKGDKLQAKQVIALAGLTKKSMRKIVVGYLGEKEAEKKMTYLEQNPAIKYLCRTPVWLIFTLMVLDLELNLEPTTMTSILVLLLQNMFRSEHVYGNKENIGVVVDKLEKMAFTGTKEKKVEFSLDELGEFNLIESEISALVIATKRGRHQKLIQGESILMYAHQTLQEVFSAFHIAKMNNKELKNFISEHIHDDHYGYVRRFLTGILLNNEVFGKADLGDAKDFEQKKIYLKESLEKRLRVYQDERKFSPDALLQFYMCLHEAGDGAKDILKNKVPKFEFSRVALLPSEMHSIGWVMSQQSEVTTLELDKCNLTETSLSALYHGLEDSNVQLHQLKIPNNENLGPDEMKLVAKIFVRCKALILELCRCNPKSDALKAFLDYSRRAKLDELDVSVNTFEPDQMKVIAKICKQREVDRFCVRHCKFRPGALEQFLRHSVGTKLILLDIGNITPLDGNDRTLLGKITKQCDVKTLAALDPDDLNSIDIKEFTLSPDNFKITRFECGKAFSDIHILFSDSFCDSVGNFLTYVTKEVILLKYNIPSDVEKKLQERLDEGCNKSLKIIFKQCFFYDSQKDEKDKKYEDLKVLECREQYAENGAIVDAEKAKRHAPPSEITDNLRERQPGPQHGGDSNEGKGPSTEASFSSGNAPIHLAQCTVIISATTNTVPRSTQP